MSTGLFLSVGASMQFSTAFMKKVPMIIQLALGFSSPFPDVQATALVYSSKYENNAISSSLKSHVYRRSNCQAVIGIHSQLYYGRTTLRLLFSTLYVLSTNRSTLIFAACVAIAIDDHNTATEISNDRYLVAVSRESELLGGRVGVRVFSITRPAPIPCPIHVPAICSVGDGSWEAKWEVDNSAP